MVAPTPLPDGFEGKPFGVKAARAAGISAKRLRGADLDHPFPGVRRPLAAGDSLIERSAAFMPRMPSGGFFCGPTAARIQGIPLPLGIETESVLHVAVRPPLRSVRAAGIVGHKLDVDPAAIRQWRGLPVTEPARTWRDLAALLSLPDLVAAGDYLLHGRHAPCTRTELHRVATDAVHARGARRLREAIGMLDGRAESRAESRLRVVLMRADITGYEPNHWVSLPRPRVRYRIDIAFPAAMLGLEYQGEYHHDIGQWRDDMTRLSRLRAYGWNMVEVSARDLDDPAELADRIRRLLLLRRE